MIIIFAPLLRCYSLISIINKLTSCAGRTGHARREFFSFVSKLQYSFKSHLSISQAKQITNSLLLNTDEFKKKRERPTTVYGLGHSLWSAVSCQRKWSAKPASSTSKTFPYTSTRVQYRNVNIYKIYVCMHVYIYIYIYMYI